MQSPIIIIGMHRSGTSMITNMLESAGLFVGWRKDAHDEALFFQYLNDWLLHQSGGAWDRPEHFEAMLSYADVKNLSVDYLRHLANSPHTISYLGFSKYIRYRSLLRLDQPWGWKDPRTTYTLRLWMEVFPKAKVIHIQRHGVDVARSLLVREQKRIKYTYSLHEKRKRFYLYWLHRKQRGFISSIRCLTLEGGFELWEMYMDMAQKQIDQLNTPNLTVKYEDFLAEPHTHLTTLAEFVGLEISPTAIDQIVQDVNADRAYAFQRDRELTAYAEEVSERLALRGY